MRIQQEKPEFRPVTITLETKTELQEIMSLFRDLGRLSNGFTDSLDLGKNYEAIQDWVDMLNDFYCREDEP